MRRCSAWQPPALRRRSVGVVVSGLLPGLLVVAAAATASGPEDRTPFCSHPVRVLTPDGVPIPQARISPVGSEGGATTDAEGRACLADAPAGTTLMVTASGWAVGGGSLAATSDAPEREIVITLQPAFGEEMVVSATGKLRRLQDVPVHLQQIGRDQIVASAARSLAEAIEFTPGLRIESNCANCNTTSVRLLGLEGPYTQIVVEGQPTVSSLALVYGLEQIPARMLDGIEVLKGSGSALYGASSVAGTINLLPHQADHTHVDLAWESSRLQGNDSRSGGSLRGLVDWGAADGRSSASVHGQRDEVPAVDVDGDGFSEVTRRELLAVGARGHALFGDDGGWPLTADLNWTDAARRGGDFDERIALPPDQTAVTEAIDTRTVAGSLRLLHVVSSRVDLRAALSRVEIERDSYYGADFDPDAYGASSGATTVAGLQVHHALRRSTLTWGVQAERDELVDVQLGYGRQIEETNENVGLFAQEDRALGGGFSLLYGLRVDQHSAIDDPIVSPRGALLWNPSDDVTLRAAIGTGFRPPSTFDEDLHIELVGGGVARVVRDDPELVEERSRSALFSLEWRPTLGRRNSAAFELSLFETRLADLFFQREQDDPQTPELELLRVNLGGARVRGIEGSGSLRVGSAVQIDGGLVLQSARFDDPEPDFGSRDFYRTPELYGTLSLRWQPAPRWSLFVGAIHTGEMLAPHYAGFIPEDRLERTPFFLTLDANASHTFELGGERQIVLTVGLRNLTDEYQQDLDRGPLRDPSYVVGPRAPRSLFAAVDLRF